MQEKRQNIEIEKKKKGKRKEQIKKKGTHKFFQKCDIFQKSKDVKKEEIQKLNTKEM